jgi:hypothetical protein
MTASPPQVDIDGFRRLDGKPIGGHKSWWKIYDGTSIEIFDNGEDLKTSLSVKKRVDDSEFTDKKKNIKYDQSKNWAVPIKLIDDVQRNKKRRITMYHVVTSQPPDGSFSGG